MRETRTTPRALYVAIEGIDGAGKTTVAVEVYNRLVLSGVRCALVSEPYTDIVTRVFELLGRLDPLTEAYLFAADRVALHRGPLKRLLESREVVLSDRSYVASLAYQVVRGVPEELVESLNTPCSIPDRVYLLDVPVDVALSRLASRPVDESRKRLPYLESPKTLEEVRKRYLELALRGIFEAIVIDATRPVEMVANEIATDIVKTLRSKNSRAGDRRG